LFSRRFYIVDAKPVPKGKGVLDQGKNSDKTGGYAFFAEEEHVDWSGAVAKTGRVRGIGLQRLWL